MIPARVEKGGRTAGGTSHGVPLPDGRPSALVYVQWSPVWETGPSSAG